MEKAQFLEPIEIRCEDGFTVRHGDRVCGDLTWDEMLGQVVGLTHPKIRNAHYRMMTPGEQAEEEARRATRLPVAQRSVRLCVSHKEAQQFVSAIEKLVTWSAGVRAALPHSADRWPPSLGALSEFSDLLKQEMERVEKL